ncbi:MAG: hydroxymethylglutaryl-CoA reductase [Lentimicrobiaceae bacterium]|nr:hydroxymethylglutaryl-CoA reductase [Lentimicrobiaceae bacterium]MCO5265697.1 hydroxymethylglutaryl-CoA reductase [Lentimicrobium sp.]HPG33107.1 hydroxymethylglutaryl-CoA reductase [Lentimicrobium sp.]
MNKIKILSGFSKLSKNKKLELIASGSPNPAEVIAQLKSFWHSDPKVQKLFDEFSENTLTNYYFPYGLAPNVLLNGKMYMVPMVIEESSVIAAASNSAKYWAGKGGFHSEVISVTKIGQVHFNWSGNFAELKNMFPQLRKLLLDRTAAITANMEARGGGVLSMELVDMTHELKDYYQLLVKFDTRDSMGANFINSCLEEYAAGIREFVNETAYFSRKDLKIIMSILSNYTPECLVKTWVECDVADLSDISEELSGEEFAWKFEQAVKIAHIDVYRATTHNKGIFNGIDSVVLATGNDFRAIEACGHAWAARSGKYRSLTDVKVENGRFHYSLTVPIAIGTVGGLTSLHPMARFSLNLLGNPQAPELMQIAAAIGLANNFGAIRSLTTKGIQVGHMKMHLLNILNVFNASESEKNGAVEYFKHHKVTHNAVAAYIQAGRIAQANN